ncbi:multiple epidermal growth factor domains protein 6, partial [Biomphalaria glabrata]
KGSLLVDTTFVISGTEINVIDDPTTNTAANFTNFLYKLLQSNVIINNKTYNFTKVSVNGIIVPSEASKCDIYKNVRNITCDGCIWDDVSDQPICTIVCNSTHYGPNCTLQCTCTMANTADCNDVNGTCSCKPGWTGTNCDQDIDECTINSSFCTNSSESCHNLNGSAECICKVGYYRPTSGAACQASVKDDDKDLIIGLAVGIPLFVILTVVVLVLVCLYVRRKSSRNLGSVSEERESPFGRFFPTRLDPKGSWGTPSLYKADAYSEAGTSQNSRDGQLIRKTKKKSPGFQDSAWYASTSSSVQPAAGQEQG